MSGGGWIGDHMFWVLVLCGIATCSMLLQAVAPRFSTRFIFGDEIASASAVLIARSWGLLVFASGVLLIASAYHPEFRVPVLINAIAGKLGFVVLVLADAKRYLKRPAFAMAVIDLGMVALFAWYLLS